MFTPSKQLLTAVLQQAVCSSSYDPLVSAVFALADQKKLDTPGAIRGSPPTLGALLEPEGRILVLLVVLARALLLESLL